MSQANKQVITHEVSISQEFYAEMARVVGSVGEYLVFDGQEEAINYLKDAGCRIIEEGDDCLVFEDMDEARQEVADNSDVGDVFSQSAIETWVAENSSIEDVFNEDEIVEWVQENISNDDIFGWFEDDEVKSAYKKIREKEKKNMPEGERKKEKTLLGNGRFMTLLTPEQVEEQKSLIEKLTERTCDYEFILKENEELKKKNVALTRAFDDLMLLRNIFSDLIFNNRTAKDGQVWKFNSNAGEGEWC